MKGFFPRTALALSVSLSLVAGCATYRELVDPCWPERYDSMARHAVNEAAYAQAYNGHVLDQTVWNYHFESDPKTGAPTARLTPAGMEHLKYISRRRPAPDTRIYLATAQDIPGLATQPADKILEVRAKLNSDRIAAIQRFLAIQTGSPVAFAIEIHDPAEVDLDATQITGTLPLARPLQILGGYQKLQNNFQGALPDAAGSFSGGGGVGGGGVGGGGVGGGGVGGGTAAPMPR
jgi:hypothetical protein